MPRRCRGSGISARISRMERGEDIARPPAWDWASPIYRRYGLLPKSTIEQPWVGLERVCEWTFAALYRHEQDANLSQRSHRRPMGLDPALVTQTLPTRSTPKPGLPPCSRCHLLPRTHRLPVAAIAPRFPALGHRGPLLLTLASGPPVAAYPPHPACRCPPPGRQETHAKENPICKHALILVDDGSTDSTSELLQQWADRPDVVLMRHSHNRGKGAAIRTGLAHVGGRNAQALTRPRECGPFLRNEKIAKSRQRV
jgi:hypothetical protein